MPRLSIALAAILWGTTGTAQALASTHAHPLAVGAVRMILGAACLLAVVWWTDRPGLYHPWPRRITIGAGLGVALYQASFFAAVQSMGVAAGTIMAIGSSPVAAGLLGFLLHKERPSAAWYPATFLAILGCTTLAAGPETDLAWQGAPLAITAGAAYALYSAACKHLMTSRKPTTAMAGIFATAALMLCPILFFLDLSWLATPRATLAMAHLGLVATALAYVLFSHGLRTTPVSSAVTLSLLEPLTAALLGTLLLDEILTTRQIIGIVSILLGMGILALETLPMPRKLTTTKKQRR
jgi:DME family drug/metabolite transporter